MKRYLLNVARDGVAGEAFSESFDELFALCYWYFEMANTWDAIKLVEVVGEDTAVD